jgi:hypothetical protein
MNDDMIYSSPARASRVIPTETPEETPTEQPKEQAAVLTSSEHPESRRSSSPRRSRGVHGIHNGIVEGRRRGIGVGEDARKRTAARVATKIDEFTWELSHGPPRYRRGGALVR